MLLVRYTYQQGQNFALVFVVAGQGCIPTLSSTERHAAAIRTSYRRFESENVEVGKNKKKGDNIGFLKLVSLHTYIYILSNNFRETEMSNF